ncbi:MAG: hybrid sensor histidine kinase/response regulator [Paludibacter sp.]|nr:hybrid sensor histidine kinase/response regulator [Paludibacter sp.]
MNIENKIRFKAIGLYIVAGIVVTGMVVFLYGLKNKTELQKANIEKQHLSLSLTHKLITAVGDAQSSASLYISTKDTSHIEQFDQNLLQIDSVIQELIDIEPIEKTRLEEIRHLLSLQNSNILILNQWFNQENPLTGISNRLKNYDPAKRRAINIVTITQDTIYNQKKKNFFQRIRNVFSPDRDSNYTVTSKRIDTLRTRSSDSLAILNEVDQIAKDASKNYEQNMRAIEQQVGELISADRGISTQISGLLLELHKRTLDSVMTSITESEESIGNNYTLSVIGGIIALILILIFVLLIIYDVNKGKEAREKIREVMESRHQLLLSVSHDIKTPLNSILGYLDIGKPTQKDIKSMENSARHILALLENLLEFSSLEQGSLTTTFSTFSSETIANETAEMFKPLAEAKGLSFIYQADSVRINSDYMKIKQIMINLVSNAIKYTRQGSVSLKMNYADAKLSIQVTDTGVGIPSEKISELYLPFTRIESNNTMAQGTGLGMYVVKGLSDLLQAKININSKPQKGTIIQVDIPCEQVTYTIPAGKKRIAIYDDDPVLLSVLRDMLLQLGHEIVDKNYEIILTDLEMGETSGLDILANANSVPVIVMTGRGDFSLEKAKQMGFDGYLPKPFSINNLRDILGDSGNSLNDFLGEDREAILVLFKNSTAENFLLLRQALDTDNFTKAQALCHKMFPMFAQLGYPAEELRRMDSHRGNKYNDWKLDVEKILEIKV